MLKLAMVSNAQHDVESATICGEWDHVTRSYTVIGHEAYIVRSELNIYVFISMSESLPRREDY